jgi:hypothetical protein
LATIFQFANFTGFSISNLPASQHQLNITDTHSRTVGRQAIILALKQNHSIHLRSLSVEQMQSRRNEARSNYLPQIKTSGSVLHVTELAGVEIPSGALGSYPSTGSIRRSLCSSVKAVSPDTPGAWD